PATSRAVVIVNSVTATTKAKSTFLYKIIGRSLTSELAFADGTQWATDTALAGTPCRPHEEQRAQQAGRVKAAACAARGRAAPALRRRNRWATQPLNQHSCSLDDLVGTDEDRLRDNQAERLRG